MSVFNGLVHFTGGYLFLCFFLVSKLCKKAKGHGPKKACDHDDNEVACSVSCSNTEQRVERCLEECLDQNNGDNAADDLDDLCPPDGFDVIAEPFVVKEVDDHHAAYNSKQLGGVFDRALEVYGIGIGREGIKIYKEKNTERNCKDRKQSAVHYPRIFVFLHHDRVEDKKKHRTDSEGNEDVLWRVDTEIHSRKSNQYHDGKRAVTQPFPFLFGKGNAAKECGCTLRVTAGEGITRSLGARRFHNLKAWVNHPRPRNAENDFEELIDHSSHKARKQNEVAAFFVNTPQKEKTDSQKDGFFTKMRNDAKKKIAKACSDRLQKL